MLKPLSKRPLQTLFLLGGLALQGCATPPGASPEPIPGSRPGLTDDPVIVPSGSLQGEVGLDAGRFAGEDFVAGEGLVRLGLSRSIEARLALESHGGRGAAAPGHALGDLEAGFKIALAHEGEGGGAPAVSLLPSVGFPTGAERLSSGGLEAGALLVAGWGGPGLEWTLNVGGTAARADEGRFLDLFLGLAAGHGVTERLEVEVEVVRTLERGGHAEGPGLRHAALGTAWLVHPDLQLDAWAGVQREGVERGRFFGLGLSARR